jgi:hypothetical protein
MNEHNWVLLANYCKQANITIRNGEERSGEILARTGVKQGGPASPKLFAVYINELITELIATNKLANVEHTTAGVICYADDLTILCNTREDMQACLDLVNKYCVASDIIINTKKTKWMAFGTYYQRNKSNKETFSIGKEAIEKVNKFKYLGYWLQENRKENLHLNTRTTNMIKRSYGLKKVGYNNINLDLKLRRLLHNTYNRSTLLYCIENVVLNQTQIKKLKTTENLIIKRSLSLSKYVSTRKLLTALEIMDLEVTIKARKLNFTSQIMKNEMTRSIAVHMLRSSVQDSIIRTNLRDCINVQDALSLDKMDEIYSLLERVNIMVAKTMNFDEIDKDLLEAIKYLLRNRNSENNAILEIMLANNQETRNHYKQYR